MFYWSWDIRHTRPIFVTHPSHFSPLLRLRSYPVSGAACLLDQLFDAHDVVGYVVVGVDFRTQLLHLSEFIQQRWDRVAQVFHCVCGNEINQIHRHTFIISKATRRNVPSPAMSTSLSMRLMLAWSGDPLAFSALIASISAFMSFSLFIVSLAEAFAACAVFLAMSIIVPMSPMWKEETGSGNRMNSL